MAARRRCAACGKTFKVLPQVPDQSYCSDKPCQRERRKLWQRAHRITDPDYRENQARAQEAWLQRNPDYWRRYRNRNPEYTQQNRDRQRARTLERAQSEGQEAANDADIASQVASGLYQLTLVAVQRVAKMDVSYLVKLVRVEDPRVL